MSISLAEILMGRVQLKDLPKDQQDNIMDLFERINKVRSAYGKPMKVNDGYRRAQDAPKNGAAASNHFKGAAIDLDDDDAGTLWKWLMQPKQMQMLKDLGLWLEHGCWTHSAGGTWVHFQIFPPKSGHRIYVPSTAPNPNPSFWDGKYDSKYD